MNSRTSQPPVKGRPVDWIAWFLWIILFVVIVVWGFLIYRKSLAQIEVWIPVKDLPAYHLVVDSDVMKITKTVSGLPADVLSANTSPVDTYTRQSVSSDRVLSRDDVVFPGDPQLTMNTVPISIPATEAMIFGNRLTSGQVVAVWQVPTATDTTNVTSQLLADRILVLDVLSASSVPAADAEKFPYVVILAVPIDRGEILSTAAKGLLVFTLQP